MPLCLENPDGFNKDRKALRWSQQSRLGVLDSTFDRSEPPGTRSRSNADFTDANLTDANNGHLEDESEV